MRVRASESICLLGNQACVSGCSTTSDAQSRAAFCYPEPVIPYMICVSGVAPTTLPLDNSDGSVQLLPSCGVEGLLRADDRFVSDGAITLIELKVLLNIEYIACNCGKYQMEVFSQRCF
jgi:hypothetical protein